MRSTQILNPPAIQAPFLSLKTREMAVENGHLVIETFALMKPDKTHPYKTEDNNALNSRQDHICNSSAAALSLDNS